MNTLLDILVHLLVASGLGLAVYGIWRGVKRAYLAWKHRPPF